MKIILTGIPYKLTENVFGIKIELIRWLLILIMMLIIINTKAQQSNQTITITGGPFAESLVNKWALEFAKINPGLTIKFLKSTATDNKADLKISEYDSDMSGQNSSFRFVSVGRLAVLPVANDKNKLISRFIKEGLGLENFKNLFIQGKNDEEGELKASPTIYSQSAKSTPTKILLAYFGNPSATLNGVTVTGDEKYLIESVESDTTGITYSNLSLIYNLQSRTPIAGLKILPIDLDNNGRLKKEEMIFDNLDQVITYIETSKSKAIPSNDFGFVFNPTGNPLVADFVNWVASSGQEFNHQLGFLKSSTIKIDALTQK